MQPPAGHILDLERVVSRELPNGLRVRLLEDRNAPTVSYYTFFQVGSRNERLGITGISHLFEHMMFNGAAKYGPKEFDRVLESQGGSSNAYTSNDVTAYFEDFATDALPVVIDLESDRMRSLTLTPETLEQERQVVKEERRLRTENSVFGLMEEQLESLVFQAHPYRWPVIGWMDDIERITREDCVEYFRTYYAPSNAVVYAVGDLDPDETLALIERHYGDVPAGPRPRPVPQGEPPQRGERRAVVRYPAQAAAVLAVGEASRLRRRLVEAEEVAVSVQVSWGWRIDPGVFLAFAELAPGVKAERAEALLWEELATLSTKGIGARELERAKRLLRSSVLHELATHNGVAHALGQAEALLGDWREAGRSLAQYAAVTVKDVKRVVATWLDPSRRSVVTLEPEARP